MSFEVLSTGDFERELKRLAKKHRSLRDDVAKLGRALSTDPPRKGHPSVRAATRSDSPSLPRAKASQEVRG